MKVLVLDGSPKVKSDTMVATNSFLNGLKDNCDCEINVIKMIKKNIKPCLGCFLCWKNKDGKCIQKDDQNELLAEFVKADVVILSFPLYCYSMPSHLKAFIDRIIPLAKQSMKIENGHVEHDSLVDFMNKKILVISGCGFPAFEDNFLGLKIQLRNLFHNYQGIFFSEAPMLNVPEAKPVTQPLVEKFFNAGKEYAINKILSDAIISELEKPMIPMEAYVGIVNSNN